MHYKTLFDVYCGSLHGNTPLLQCAQDLTRWRSGSNALLEAKRTVAAFSMEAKVLDDNLDSGAS